MSTEDQCVECGVRDDEAEYCGICVYGPLCPGCMAEHQGGHSDSERLSSG